MWRLRFWMNPKPKTLSRCAACLTAEPWRWVDARLVSLQSLKDDEEMLRAEVQKKFCANRKVLWLRLETCTIGVSFVWRFWERKLRSSDCRFVFRFVKYSVCEANILDLQPGYDFMWIMIMSMVISNSHLKRNFHHALHHAVGAICYVLGF
jgi:hypothetical protein